MILYEQNLIPQDFSRKTVFSNMPVPKGQFLEINFNFFFIIIVVNWLNITWSKN